MKPSVLMFNTFSFYRRLELVTLTVDVREVCLYDNLQSPNGVDNSSRRCSSLLWCSWIIQVTSSPQARLWADYAQLQELWFVKYLVQQTHLDSWKFLLDSENIWVLAWHKTESSIFIHGFISAFCLCGSLFWTIYVKV